MNDILTRIVETKSREVTRRKQELPQAQLERLLADRKEPRGFLTSLCHDRQIAVIAEIKRCSPSAGMLAENPDLASRVSSYEGGGARAISVLVDGTFFGGSYQDLELVRRSCSLPILAKEFIVDPYQLWEVRTRGADAVLLIARILPLKELTRLLQLAGKLQLDCLVEVHSREELSSLPPLPPWAIIGINNRNLATFKTDIHTTLSLLPLLEPGQYVVSESGINSREDVRLLRENGVSAFLVGEALMRAEDPKHLLRELCRDES